MKIATYIRKVASE
uniref:Uncharacterized protein n=1 Tax=Arundo donax TaxID=35708 RepID=A0A0A9H9F9_ARUDO